MNKQQTEPVNVAKFWDDVLLGVKGLSSLVIAGSPRNLFKQIGCFFYYQVMLNMIVARLDYNLSSSGNLQLNRRVVQRLCVKRETDQNTS